MMPRTTMRSLWLTRSPPGVAHELVRERLMGGVLHLPPVEACVESAQGHELGMRALLHRFAVVDDQHAVRAANGGQPVRDDQCRAALSETVERVQQERLRAGVERRGRLVENQNGGVLEKG